MLTSAFATGLPLNVTCTITAASSPGGTLDCAGAADSTSPSGVGVWVGIAVFVGNGVTEGEGIVVAVEDGTELAVGVGVSVEIAVGVSVGTGIVGVAPGPGVPPKHFEVSNLQSLVQSNVPPPGNPCVAQVSPRRSWVSHCSAPRATPLPQNVLIVTVPVTESP